MGFARHDAGGREQLPQAPEGQAHHRAVAALEGGDRGHVLVLDGVGAGLVQRASAGDVGGDGLVVEAGHGDLGSADIAGGAARGDDGHAGQDAVRSPSQGTQHRDRIVGIGGLAVGALAVVNDGVGADDDGAGMAAGDGRGFLAGEAAGISAGVVGGVLGDASRVDNEVVEEGAQQLASAGRGGGEDDAWGHGYPAARVRRETHSMWAVCGNMSMGVTDSSV